MSTAAPIQMHEQLLKIPTAPSRHSHTPTPYSPWQEGHLPTVVGCEYRLHILCGLELCTPRLNGLLLASLAAGVLAESLGCRQGAQLGALIPPPSTNTAKHILYVRMRTLA